MLGLPTRLFGSVALHAMFFAAAWLAGVRFGGPPPILDPVAVPVEIVTSADTTDIRAAAPEVATLAPTFEDKGETLSAEAAPPPEPMPAIDPLPTPRREPPRREARLDLDDLDNLINRDPAERGSRERDAAPAAERALRPREAVGAGRQLTATQTAQLRSLLADQISRCARSAADRENPDLATGLRFRLTRSGELEGPPVLTRSSGDRAFDDSALRAVRLCAPYELGALQELAAGIDLNTNYAPGQR